VPSSNPLQGNLATRIFSAAALIPAVVGAIWYGGAVFLLMLAIAIGLLSIEWGKMSAPDAPAEVAVTITVAVLTGVFAAYNGWYRLSWLLMIGGAIAAAIASRHRTERAADAGYGVIYIAPACIIMVWLRDTASETFSLETWNIPGPGVSWMITLFAVTWAADIGAYGVGRIVGGTKLWPRISPNKTWAGFVGGLIIATLVGLAAWRLLPALGISVRTALIVGFAGGAATMAGDLWESILKRRFGVKDSGDLIPGHGGLFDRVDGLMFAVMAVAFCRLAVIQGWME
jgi:phosphatidate cytidylyltransferase